MHWIYQTCSKCDKKLIGLVKTSGDIPTCRTSPVRWLKTKNVPGCRSLQAHTHTHMQMRTSTQYTKQNIHPHKEYTHICTHTQSHTHTHTQKTEVQLECLVMSSNQAPSVPHMCFSVFGPVLTIPSLERKEMMAFRLLSSRGNASTRKPFKSSQFVSLGGNYAPLAMPLLHLISATSGTTYR